MAKKIDKPAAKPAPVSSEAAAAAELEVEFPERTITLAGESVTVTEIGFVAGLRLQRHVAPLVADIETLMLETQQAPEYDQVVSVLAGRLDATLALIAEATGKDGDWLAGLRGRDGDALLLTFWSVNAAFFIQRAVSSMAIRAETRRLSAGANSSPPSAPTATGAATSSVPPPAS